MVYIDGRSHGGDESGSSWANAAENLALALQNAPAGTEFHVAPGTYYPTFTGDRSISFVPKTGDKIYGGYAGTAALDVGGDPEATGAGQTILTGNVGNQGLASDNSYHVMNATGVTNLDLRDLTFYQGNATGTGIDRYGAGLLMGSSASATVTVTSCVFSGNNAQLFGGGVYVPAGCTATFASCLFVNNTADSGGGVRTESQLASFDLCTFKSNTALSGGGLNIVVTTSSQTVYVSRSSFLGNRATDNGGAISNGYGSQAQVANCVFALNSSDRVGGAIEDEFGSSGMVVYLSTFTGNSAPDGGAVRVYAANFVAIDSIFWGDSATAGTAEISAASGTSPATTSAVGYSVVQGGFAGTGNIDADPQFVSAPVNRSSEGDLRLRIGSPAIDAGTAVSIADDRNGSSRPAGNGYDMGAYEGAVDAVPPTSHVNAFAHDSAALSFTVSWTGSDNVGVVSYDILVSDNSGAYAPLLAATTATSTTFTGVAGHTYRFYSVARDARGNLEAAPSTPDAALAVDSVAPTSAVMVSSPYSKILSITVPSNVSDAITGSAPASVTYFVSDNGGLFSSAGTAAAGTPLPFTGENGHTYAFYTVASDNAGNVEIKAPHGEATVTFDTVAPTSTLTVPANFVNTTSFPLSWSGSDATPGSGIATYTVAYTVDNDSFTYLVTNTAATSGTFAGTPGHLYAFILTATDNAGNIDPDGSYKAHVYIDAAPPTSSVDALPAASDNDVFVSWSGTDDSFLHAVASLTYTVYVSEDGGSYVPFVQDAPVTNATYHGRPGHTYSFYSVATDLAGNTESKAPSAEATTVTDATPPEASVNPLPSTTYTAAIPVSWSGQDGQDGIGIASYTLYVRADGGPYSAYLTNTTATSADYPAANDSTYDFYVTATDLAGNVSSPLQFSQASTTVSVDAAPPTSAMDPGSGISYATLIPISWSGNDDKSGIVSYDIFISDNGGPYALALHDSTALAASIPGLDRHTYSFYSVATDAAGNREADPASPDITVTVNADEPLLRERGLPGAKANLAVLASPLKLPKTVNGTVIGGTVIKGTAKVKNIGSGVASGSLAVSFYLSGDSAVSSHDVYLAEVMVPKPLKLKVGGTTSVPYTITLPADYNGAAKLLAWVNPAGEGQSTAIEESTTTDNVTALGDLRVAARTVNLSAGPLLAKSLKRGKPNAATLTVTNNSNVAFSGNLSVLTEVLDDAAAAVTTATSPTKKYNIPIGKSVKIPVTYLGPTAGDNFTLRSTVDPMHTFSQSRIDDDVSTLSLTSLFK